jgi:integrase
MVECLHVAATHRGIGTIRYFVTELRTSFEGRAMGGFGALAWCLLCRARHNRHTCAAWLVSAGVPLTDVRDLLGHSTVRMTERYAHLAPERVRSAVAVLDEVAESRLSHVRPSPAAG